MEGLIIYEDVLKFYCPSKMTFEKNTEELPIPYRCLKLGPNIGLVVQYRTTGQIMLGRPNGQKLATHRLVPICQNHLVSIEIE